MKVVFLVSPGVARGGGVLDYLSLLRAGLRSHGVAAETLAAPSAFGRTECSISGALHDLGPDVISVPFVSYAFHRKGLVGGWETWFHALRGPWKVHWMFHELWIGASIGAPLTDRMVGWLQRRGIEKLLRALPPDVVHTSNPVYRCMLREIAVDAAILPLFGNIPVVDDSGGESALRPELESSGVDRKGCFCVGFFGAIHKPWQPDSFVPELVQQAERMDKRAVVCSVGRPGRWAEQRWEEWEKRFPKVLWIRFGERSAEDVSRVLQDLDVGLNTTPWALINKSGSAAAMREHGLPVIVLRDDFRLRGTETPEPMVDSGFHRWPGRPDVEWWNRALQTPPPFPHTVEGIARRFVEAVLQ